MATFKLAFKMTIRSRIWGSHEFRRYRTFSVFLPIFKRPIDYMTSKAVIDQAGCYTHGGLLNAAKQLSNEISSVLKGRKQDRVAFFAPPSVETYIITWAIWMSGQIAVPLPSRYPTIAHEYFIVDSDANLILVTEENKHLGEAVKNAAKCPLLTISPDLREKALCRMIPDPNNPENKIVDDSDFKHLKLTDIGQNDTFYRKASALINYTAGSTPKGVVFSHTSLHAQVASLVDAWRLSKRDCFLHAMPMEKNLLSMLHFAPLTVGASVVVLENLSTENIWIQLLGLRKMKDERPNIVLTRSNDIPELIKTHEKCLKKSDAMSDHVRDKCTDQIRFFAVGNGPVTRKMSQSWGDITGHQILTYFNTTETGVVTSMPIYRSKTGSSSVGVPMPGIHVRLTNDAGVGLVAEGSRAGTRVLTNAQPVTGLMEIRGENILSGYWRKPMITQESLTRDGWFKTSDLAKYSHGMYSVLGNSETDVYRKGDHKYSIPLVEAIILNNNRIKDVAVLENRLLQDTKLLAFVVADGMLVDEITKWINEEIPNLPIEVEIVGEIPKNWSGKKNRQKILELYDQQLKNQYLKEKNEKDKREQIVAAVGVSTPPPPQVQPQAVASSKSPP